MCGIAGIVHFDTTKPVDRPLLEKMTDVLSHRGPDGRGFYVDGHIGLGHRRLAIIDLTTGDQPKLSADENLVIVFNGEIYNYIELREELKALGHNFTTASDTEVILNAYTEWGPECQKRLNGMWAFALWDKREQQLLLSRDRLGEKPLHYSFQDNSLLFGSEIKSILAAGQKQPIATHLWHIYLSLGYLPAPHTFYQDIQKLPPAHYLLVKNGNIRERCYWEFPLSLEEEMRTDAAQIYQEFQSCFFDSVRIRMRSDVPFGAFLSGGLDSSGVVAAMVEESRSPVETFTIGFEDNAFDERKIAREVAEWFGTNHHEEIVRPESFDESLTNVLHQFDEPFGDASAVPVGMVSKLARQRVTMALTGDGGDEVLSGYTSYVTEKITGYYQSIPAIVRGGVYQAVNISSLLATNDSRYRLNRLKRFLRLSDESFNDRFTDKLSLLNRGAIRNLIPNDTKQFSIEDYLSDLFAKCPFKDPFYKLMYFNLKVSLPDDMLSKVDRMSMAHSLETRVPFLDHRLVELAVTVHKNVKLPGRNRKNLLKQTYGRRLPPSLLKGPKRSFCVPLREWFKQDDFAEKLSDLQKKDYGLNRKVIAQILDANRAGKQDYGDFIWRLFAFAKWLDERKPVYANVRHLSPTTT